MGSLFVASMAMLIPLDVPTIWQAELVSGEKVEGNSLESQPNGKWKIGDRNEIPGDQIVSIRNSKLPIPCWPEEAQILFRNGDRWAGNPTEGDQRSITIRIAWNPNSLVKLPVSRIESIQFTSKANEARELKRRDEVLFVGGDILTGTYLSVSLTANRVLFDVEGKERAIPLEQIRGMSFNSELGTSRPTEQSWRLTLRNGSRVSLVTMKIQDEKIQGVTSFKSEIEISLAELVHLESVRPSIQSLSLLKPLKFQYTPFLDETRNWEKDRTLDRRQLSLRTDRGIEFYDRGLSMASKSSIVFSLNGEYSWFCSEVGLDPISGARGSAVIAVRVDDREVDLQEKARLSPKDVAKNLRLPLAGAKKLELSVDWGDGGPIGDTINWGGAKLIRK